jgi:hypothetical protein
MIQLTTVSLKLEEKYEEELVSGVPICGSNFSTPVVDRAYHCVISFLVTDVLFRLLYSSSHVIIVSARTESKSIASIFSLGPTLL